MPKRVLQGVVVSSSSDKTVVVKVERKYTHPIYKKTMKSTKKYHAHDEQNKFQIGENIEIIECRPISKLKKWQVVYE